MSKGCSEARPGRLPSFASNAASVTSDALALSGIAGHDTFLEEPAVLSRGDRFILRAYSPPATIVGRRMRTQRLSIFRESSKPASHLR